MRLYIKSLDINITFNEGNSYSLIVEDPKVFSDIVLNLYSTINSNQADSFFLYDGDSVISITKSVEMILYPFLVDCNEKKILSKIYKELEETIEAEFADSLAKVNSMLINFWDGVLEKNFYGLTTDDALNVGGLLKLYNVRINTEPESLLEKLIEYMRVMNEVCGYYIFAFVNLNHYLSLEEMRNLYEFCRYSKIFALNISGNDYMGIEQEGKIIVDKDLCIIQ